MKCGKRVAVKISKTNARKKAFFIDAMTSHVRTHSLIGANILMILN